MIVIQLCDAERRSAAIVATVTPPGILHRHDCRLPVTLKPSDDDNVHRSRVERSVVCLLATTVSLEGQHIQTDVQGDAHLLLVVRRPERRLQSVAGQRSAKVSSQRLLFMTTAWRTGGARLSWNCTPKTDATILRVTWDTTL